MYTNLNTLSGVGGDGGNWENMRGNVFCKEKKAENGRNMHHRHRGSAAMSVWTNITFIFGVGKVGVNQLCVVHWWMQRCGPVFQCALIGIDWNTETTELTPPPHHCIVLFGGCNVGVNQHWIVIWW